MKHRASFPSVAALTAAVLAPFALAQGHDPAHHAMMHAKPQPQAHPPAAVPTMPGQDAFGAIAEIVALLEADADTDWSQVSIGRLRDHLVDMHELTLNAEVAEGRVDGGFEARITGSGRTQGAIRRMVPTHASMMQGHRGWTVHTEAGDDGVTLTVTTDDAAEVERLRALGFFGFMASGHHHGPHHLAIAAGRMMHGH